jgi:hypothetical protein
VHEKACYHLIRINRADYRRPNGALLGKQVERLQHLLECAKGRSQTLRQFLRLDRFITMIRGGWVLIISDAEGNYPMPGYADVDVCLVLRDDETDLSFIIDPNTWENLIRKDPPRDQSKGFLRGRAKAIRVLLTPSDCRHALELKLIKNPLVCGVSRTA